MCIFHCYPKVIPTETSDQFSCLYNYFSHEHVQILSKFTLDFSGFSSMLGTQKVWHISPGTSDTFMVSIFIPE